MTPDQLFDLSGPVALAGWAALVAAPLAPRLADRAAGFIIPGLLGVAYAVLIARFFTGSGGGYGSLASVQKLFAEPWLLVAGWLHYLAFDLFVGAWQVRTARREGVPHLLILPSLILTFLFGPAGLLLFLATRTARSARTREISP